MEIGEAVARFCSTRLEGRRLTCRWAVKCLCERARSSNSTFLRPHSCGCKNQYHAPADDDDDERLTAAKTTTTTEMDCDRTIPAAAFGSRLIITKPLGSPPSKPPFEEQQLSVADNLDRERKNPTRSVEPASYPKQIEISRNHVDRLVSHRRRQQQTTEPAEIRHPHHLPAAQASPSKRDTKWQNPNIKWIALNSSIFITMNIISALMFALMITFQVSFPTLASLYPTEQS